ncbi:sensor histidine kinase [Agrilactobacillus fermenti]|uniref:sensor histidine kinase n=1 Tax=Agrilactobacillus fermenti TaxID=2586909 RepID=UPI001E358C0A|nr:HAMP domain-containing sensor histidine kinase [Agrilactobacillus fermenti]
MHSLRQQLLAIVLMVLLLGSLFTVLGTKYVLPYFYWYSQRQKVTDATYAVHQGSSQQQIQDKYGASVITLSANKYNLADFNEQVQLKFQRQGVALKKIWVTTHDLKRVHNRETVVKNYNQTQQKSTFMTTMFLYHQRIYLVGLSTVHFTETAGTFISFYLAMLLLLLVLMIIAILLFTTPLIRTIRTYQHKTKQIRQQDFSPMLIYPANELGELGKNIDLMSQTIQQHETDLQQQNKAIQQLSSDLAHELKTPLTVIEAYAHAIKDGIETSEASAEIISQTEQLTALINQMLKLIKLQQAPSDSIQSLNLADVLNQQLARLQPLAKTKQLTFQLTIAKDLPSVKFAKLDVQLLLTNLLTNAIRYADQGPISIQLALVNTQLVLTVTNSFNGTIKDSAQLLKPFTVGATSRSTTESGSGLGLAIVQAIVQKYHGQLTVKAAQHRFSVTIHFATEMPH